MKPEALTNHEERIKTDPKNCLVTGEALREIQEKRLYGQGSFSEYCKNKWGWSRQKVHRLMQAYKLYQDLLPKVAKNLIPTSEGPLRALYDLKNMDLQIATLRMIEQGNLKLTAGNIEKTGALLVDNYQRSNPENRIEAFKLEKGDFDPEWAILSLSGGGESVDNRWIKLSSHLEKGGVAVVYLIPPEILKKRMRG